MLNDVFKAVGDNMNYEENCLLKQRKAFVEDFDRGAQKEKVNLDQVR